MHPSLDFLIPLWCSAPDACAGIVAALPNPREREAVLREIGKTYGAKQETDLLARVQCIREHARRAALRLAS